MKILAMVLALVLLAVPAFATCPATTVIENISYTTNVTQVVEADKDTVAGVIFDAPNLIEITPVWHVGVEGFKDFINTSAAEGIGGFIKLTYSGTLLNLSNKK